MAVGGVWIPVTLLASSAQTLRNAMQRDLIGALGAVGAAQVRFLFGLPFAVMFLVGLLAATGLSAPRLSAVSLAWTGFGAASQVIATSLMLAAMRTKSLAVGSDVQRPLRMAHWASQSWKSRHWRTSSIGDHALRMQRAQRILGSLVIERVAARPMALDVAPPATRWAAASGLAG